MPFALTEAFVMQCACGFSASDDPHDADSWGNPAEQCYEHAGSELRLLVGHYS